MRNYLDVGSIGENNHAGLKCDRSPYLKRSRMQLSAETALRDKWRD